MEHKLNAVLHSLKKNERVWIIAGIIVVPISGVIATFITAEGVARSTAKASIIETKAYLDKVTDAAQSSQAPKEIKTAVTAIEQPLFTEVPLGDLNDSYRMARTFHKEIVAKIDIFIQQIDAYAQLQVFDEEYQQLTVKLGRLPNSDIVGRYDTLKEITKLITQTKAPTDFADKFTEVGRVYGSMERNSEGIMTAQKMGNTEAGDALSQQYARAAEQVPRVEADITGYVNQIAEKVESMVNDLKRYREEL